MKESRMQKSPGLVSSTSYMCPYFDITNTTCNVFDSGERVGLRGITDLSQSRKDHKVSILKLLLCMQSDVTGFLELKRLFSYILAAMLLSLTLL